MVFSKAEVVFIVLLHVVKTKSRTFHLNRRQIVKIGKQMFRRKCQSNQFHFYKIVKKANTSIKKYNVAIFVLFVTGKCYLFVGQTYNKVRLTMLKSVVWHREQLNQI